MQYVKKLFYAAGAGIVVATGLELVVQLMWGSYYSHYPLEGYTSAMASGLVYPAFYSSSKGLLHAGVAFFVCGVLIALYDRKRAFSFAFVFLSCAVIVLSAFFFQTPDAKESQFAGIVPLFLAFYTGPSLVVGVVAGLILSFALGLNQRTL